MKKVALRVLFGLCLLCAAVYLLLHSNFLILLEGTNLDGSSSITWRSGVALLLLATFTQRISFWTFRRHIVLRVFVGLGICIVAAISLFASSFAFRWEVHDPDGTFLLTWKSDLVIIVLVAISQGVSFLIFQLIEVGRRNHPEARAFKQPNI
ncbi:MAG: hypothetical protein WCF30_19900 [Terracidiphilus sp.]